LALLSQKATLRIICLTILDVGRDLVSEDTGDETLPWKMDENCSKIEDCAWRTQMTAMLFQMQKIAKTATMRATANKIVSSIQQKTPTLSSKRVM